MFRLGVSRLVVGAPVIASFAGSRRWARGWGAESPAPQSPALSLELPRQKIANAIHALLPQTATPLTQISKSLPDEILDELDIGLKQLFEDFPSLFIFQTLQTGALGVLPGKPAIPVSLIRAIEQILINNDGTMTVEALFRDISEADRAPIVPFRTLTAALRTVSHEFTLTNKDRNVELPPHKQHLLQQLRLQQLKAIVRSTPPFTIPITVLANYEKETPLETYSRLMTRDDVFDLVTPGPAPKDMATAPNRDDILAHTYIRVLPPYHDCCTPESKSAFSSYMAEDYDAYRLARHLTTTTPCLVANLEEAERTLSRPVMQVILTFPELFKYDMERQEVTFVLRPDMRPSPLDQFTDADLDEKIATIKEKIRGCGKAKFEKIKLKEKLSKYTNAKFIRTNPVGTVFMDEHVLSMLIFDMLPTTGSVNMSRIQEIIPDYALNTTVKLNHFFFMRFPHLFVVSQPKPPEYVVHRVDVTPSEETKKFSQLPDGRSIDSMTAKDIADFIIQTAIDVGWEHNRPTLLSTVTFRMPFALRTHVRKNFTWDQIFAESNGELERASLKGDDRALSFKGPRLEKLLKPNSYGDGNRDGPRKRDQVTTPPAAADAASKSDDLPKPEAVGNVAVGCSGGAMAQTVLAPLSQSKSSGRGWVPFKPSPQDSPSKL